MDKNDLPALIVYSYAVNRIGRGLSSDSYEQAIISKLEMIYSSDYKIIRDEYLYINDDIIHHLIAKRDQPEIIKVNEDMGSVDSPLSEEPSIADFFANSMRNTLISKGGGSAD